MQVAAAPPTLFVERGEHDSPPRTDCPYNEIVDNNPDTDTCRNANLEAYYVTARYTSGGESPRSNVVFWNCQEDPGYVRLTSPREETDAIASVTDTPIFPPCRTLIFPPS
jgi:hypothetical protein